MSIFLIGTGLAALGLAGYFLTRPKPAPFHVDYPIKKMRMFGLDDAFPIFHFVLSNIPESTRRNLVVKMGAPKPNELKDRSEVPLRPMHLLHASDVVTP